MTEHPDDDDRPRRVGPLDDPAARTLVALVLAFLVLCGFGLLSGQSYVAAVSGRLSLNRDHQIAEALVGAALALPALWLAGTALRRGEPSLAWVLPAARAALVLAGLGLALRVVLLVLMLVGYEDPSVSFG
jgi:hypothetical protein